MSRRRRRNSPSFVLRDIVLRSVPSRDRPRMSAPMEARFRDIDERSAACYADLENLTHQLGETAKALRAGDLDAEIAEGSMGRLEASECSLAVHVRAARKASQKRRADTDVFTLTNDGVGE